MQVRGLIAGDGGRAFWLDGSAVAAGSGLSDRAAALRIGSARIAGWSARHRKTAVLGWLALVAVIFLGGQGLGIKSVPSYDAGQSGQAIGFEVTLCRLPEPEPGEAGTTQAA